MSTTDPLVAQAIGYPCRYIYEKEAATVPGRWISMADAVTVALGALRTAERKTGAIAHRIANVNTDGGADDRDGTAATAPSGETGMRAGTACPPIG